MFLKILFLFLFFLFLNFSVLAEGDIDQWQDSEKTYFDTNISNHHHFINETTNEIVDLKDDEVGKIKIKKNLRGKKVKSIEVLVKLENSN